MPESRGDHLDRYLAGELSGSEQRELAQAALDDPELFDELTAATVMKAVLRAESPSAPGRGPARAFKRPVAWAGIAAAAAAAIALVIVYRAASTTTPIHETTPSTPATSTSSPVADSAKIAQPVILSARLDKLAGGSTPEFRSDGAHSRPPKSHGVVVSVDDGEVGIDLGSLDGVVKGSELQVFHGADDANVVGRLTIATVFRERSRGRIASARSAQVGDRAEVAPGVQVTALLDQVAALTAAGDTGAARTLLERAVSISQLPRVPAETLNELATVLIERQDYAGAERTLRLAQPRATGVAGVRVANNLAALAALRGDAVTAESMYRSALALAGNSPDLESDRRAIQKNLEGLKPAR
jgi:hypothetical protein